MATETMETGQTGGECGQKRSNPPPSPTKKSPEKKLPKTTLEVAGGVPTMPAPSTGTNTPRSEASTTDTKLDPNAAVMEALLAKISSLEALVLQQQQQQHGKSSPMMVVTPLSSKLSSPSTAPTPSSAPMRASNEGSTETLSPQGDADDEEDETTNEPANAEASTEADDMIVMPGTGTKATSPNKGYDTFLLHASYMHVCGAPLVLSDLNMFNLR